MASIDPLKLDSLDALHDAIRASIAAQFPDFVTVEFYRDDEAENIPTPACLLELDEIEFTDPADPGTEQVPCTLRFNARLLFSREKSADVPLEVRKAGVSLAMFIHRKRFGLKIGPVRLIQSMADDFDPRLRAWSVWRIEWTQEAFLGDTVWTNDGTVPQQVFAGIAPAIGAGNEPAYTDVTA